MALTYLAEAMCLRLMKSELRVCDAEFRAVVMIQRSGADSLCRPAIGYYEELTSESLTLNDCEHLSECNSFNSL